jgi:hypothetical protein
MHRAAVLVAGLVLLAGCSSTTGGGQATGTTSAVHEGSLLQEGIGKAIAAWKGVLGSSIMAVSVDVYPDYAILEAQDPDLPAHVDRYQYRRGDGLLDPDPVSMTDQDEQDLGLELFPLDSVEWEKLPGLVEQALTAADVEQPSSVYVDVARDRPTTEAVRLRVWVSGERSSGYLVADARGNVVETYDD